MQNTNYKIQIIFIALSTFISTTAVASQNGSLNSNTSGYVDSVTQWGAWDLDIEPAAGGPVQPETQALNPRSSNVSLRANSISALAATPRQMPPVPNQIPVAPTPANPVGPTGPVGPANFAPAAATPATTIIVNLPPSTNVTPVAPGSIPSGTGGLF